MRIHQSQKMAGGQRFTPPERGVDDKDRTSVPGLDACYALPASQPNAQLAKLNRAGVQFIFINQAVTGQARDIDPRRMSAVREVSAHEESVAISAWAIVATVGATFVECEVLHRL
jgi:hypothetical protein